MLLEDLEKVKRDVVAKVLGVSVKQVNNLVKREVLRQSAPRLYSLPDCVRRYIRFKGADTPDSYIASQKALADARTRQLDLRNALEERRLLPTEDVQRIAQELGVLVAQHLESQPSRMATMLAGISDPAQIRDLLLAENRRIRQQLAETSAKLAGPVTDTPPPPPLKSIMVTTDEDAKLSAQRQKKAAKPKDKHACNTSKTSGR